MADTERPTDAHLDDETLVHDGGASPTSGAIDGGRFTPGEIVDARYRIVSLLGRGGMGEVYRADDLRLGEPVALKFLPPALTNDGAALARFHQEVKTARQITHRNVVRVHDLGEANGAPFLTMEYVDGEDLASLIKRIGRLPQDKALELARQLCAGLAAAHERGVLHRDIKPANVMIDGEGRAKLSDFGLAEVAADLGPEIVGTPAYMAPEQLSDGETSFASDIYSLGLVLFETFSGRSPFRAKTAAELRSLHDSTDPETLSTDVSGIDPLVDGVLRKCLQRVPDARPQSALSVSAALPGGDPIAAALAAGETPSPEMVARAAGQESLSRPKAVGLLLAGLALLVGAVYTRSLGLAPTIAPPLEPEVLAHRASELLAEVGWERRFASRGWAHTGWTLTELTERRSLEEWRELSRGRPTFITFWYRSSDRPIRTVGRWSWKVRRRDPPLNTPGVATVELDGQGRLRSLLVPRELAAPQDSAFDMSSYFEAAELEIEEFESVTPSRAPPHYADELRAWSGRYPGAAGRPVTVHAASQAGQLVWWSLDDGEPRFDVAGAMGPRYTLALLLLASVWVVGGVLAYRHYRSGKGDRNGALRLATYIACTGLLAGLVTIDLRAAPPSMGQLFSLLASSLMFAVLFWLLYMTIEPFARRHWPRALTSWTRLLQGQFADALVGRDVLIGVAVGNAAIFLTSIWNLTHSGGPRLIWVPPHGWGPIDGVPTVIANAVGVIPPVLVFVLILWLVTFRALLKNPWLAVAAAAVLVVGFNVLFQPDGVDLPNVLQPILLLSIGAGVGMLALAATAFTLNSVMLIPVAIDPSIWWSGPSIVAWGLVAVLAFYGFWATTRPSS